MKKFLTVLLVIAVMFTFSFSTALAAGVSGYDKNLAARYFELEMDAVKTAGSITVSQTISSTTYNYVVKYATLEAHRAELLEAVLDYDKNTAASYVGDTSVGSPVTLANVVNANTSGVFTYDVTMALVAAQYDADKTAALAILSGLDVSEYSTKEMDAKDSDGCVTYVDHVNYLVNQAVKDINVATFNSDSTVKDYSDAKKTIDGYFDAYNGDSASYTKLVKEKGYEIAGTPSSTKVGLGVYVLNTAYVVGSKTLANYKASYVDAQEASSAADIATNKAQIASAYATYMTTATTADQKTFAANLKTVLDFLAEKEVNVIGSPATTYGWYFTNGNAANIATAIANVKKFETEAARLAAATDVNGALVRDAEDVADYVVEGTTHAYLVALGCPGTAASYDNISTCLNKIDALYTGLGEAKLEYAKKIRETYVAKMLAYYEKEELYYPTELNKIKALTEEYLAKVNAVTDIAKVGNYDVAYLGGAVGTLNASTFALASGDVADVPKAATVNNYSAVSTLKNTAQSYLTLVNRQISKASAKYYTSGASANSARLDAEIEALVGNSSARTSKDILALSDQAVDLIKILPTVADVEAAKEAADDAVVALPATVTVADKALIDAAVAAADAYDDLTAEKYTRTSITTAITKYAHAYNNELTAKVKAVNSTDKAAVKAIVDEIDTFIETYGNSTVVATNKGTLTGYLTKIQNAAATKVTAAITAIPVAANLAEASRATVEAARAAYDAYVAEYTLYTGYTYNPGTTTTADGFVADDFDYAALLEAETLLGLNQPDPEENAKAYVQDLGIKARSAKTSKGVKVTIKADVQELLDAGFTVEYKFYRSTKSNKGFKAMVTKTTGTYTNTKGVKGTKYYYKAKLVVKNAAGEVVATTPLTQCLYATRTF